MSSNQGTSSAQGKSSTPGKHYDEGYFDRWYRREGFGSKARLERKMRYALNSAEYLLERPVRRVLDIGCGEAPWRAALLRARPRLRYTGIDPSEYAVARYGTSRNIRRGGFADAGDQRDDGPFDLIVCADVVLYVDDGDLKRGLRAIGEMLHGVAYIEVFTANDNIEGDLSLFHRRRPDTYRRWFAEAGLTHIGPHLYVGAALLPRLADFEGRWRG
jgi:SAM-dependent methyltransferase